MYKLLNQGDGSGNKEEEAYSEDVKETHLIRVGKEFDVVCETHEGKE